MNYNSQISSSYPIAVTVANEAYSLPLTVMLKSLETNLQNGIRTKVYILNKDLKQKTKQEIESCINKERVDLVWVEINSTRLHGLKVDGHISIDTYYRLLIEELFPQYPRIIYLDADIIVKQSICQLWNTEFNGRHLLAVPLASKKSGYVSGIRGLPAYKLLGIPAKTRTFNAGIMVLNLQLWRRDCISEQILGYLREYKEYVLWWDQDGLNAILYEKWLALPATWNVMTSHLADFSSWRDSLLTYTEYQEVLHSPAIIHYAGPLKPWLPDFEGPFQEIFIQYAEKLPSEYIRSFCNYAIKK